MALKIIWLAMSLVLATVLPAHAADNLQCPSPDVDRTVRDCTSIIAESAGHPSAATAHVNRAIAHWQKGAYEKAVADSDQAIRLGSKFALPYLMRGILFADAGDHHAALADFTRAIEIQPSSEAHYNRGTAHLALADYAGAVADFDQALAGDKPMASALINRGLAHLARGHSELALADVQRGVQLLPQNRLAAAALTRVLAAQAPDGLALSPPHDVGAEASRSSLAFFPASKVLPSAGMLTTDVPPRGRPPITDRPPAMLRPIVMTHPPRAHQTQIRRPPGTLQERIEACMSQWNGGAHISRAQWRDTCQRFETSFEAAGAKK